VDVKKQHYKNLKKSFFEIGQLHFEHSPRSWKFYETKKNKREKRQLFFWSR